MKPFPSWQLSLFPVEKLLGAPGALWTPNLFQVYTWSQLFTSCTRDPTASYLIFEISCFPIPHWILDDMMFIKCFCSNHKLFHLQNEWSLNSNLSLVTKSEGYSHKIFWQGQNSTGLKKCKVAGRARRLAGVQSAAHLAFSGWTLQVVPLTSIGPIWE